jgi:hypothetical protein
MTWRKSAGRSTGRSLQRKADFWTYVWIVSGAVAFTGNFLPERWVGIPVSALVIFLATWWPAHRLRAKCDHEARRRGARPIAAEQIGSLERPPVLYLRSFEDDPRAARIKGVLTEEEHLGKVLSQIGPFMAIGRPGEPLPAVGASRVYVGDANWQSMVEGLLRRARLVVIRTGQTTGLEWEVEQAVRLLTPERLVLLVDSARELRGMLGRIRNVHPQVKTRRWLGWRSIGSVRGFIVFDGAWRASYLRARGPGLYFFCTGEGQVGHTAKRLAWTLRPVFRNIEMTWQKPPLNWGLIILSMISAGLFLAAILLTALGR